MENNLLHRKDRIIITTIEIIDELGIKSLSTREIAKRQGVSEATLFRYFGSKNELLLAVLDYFAKFDSDIFQSAALKQISPKESIIYIVGAYAEYYENYPAVTSITQVVDVMRNNQALEEKVRYILFHRKDKITQLVEEAKAAGEIDLAIDSETLSDIIWGLCREISMRWRMSGQNFLLKERIMSALEMVLNAFETARNDG